MLQGFSTRAKDILSKEFYYLIPVIINISKFLDRPDSVLER